MTLAAPELAEVDKQARLDQLRRRIAAVPGRTRDRSDELFTDPEPITPTPAQAQTPKRRIDNQTTALSARIRSQRVLPAPPALGALLPRGGLARGTVTAVTGAHSILVALVAATTGAGEHAAIMGLPRFGLLAAHEMGADLARCAVIDNPGDDPAEVAAVLLDGVSLVVLGLGGRTVAPTRARAVTARAHTKNAALIVAEGHWSGVDLTLDARVTGYTGLGHGHGRLRGVHLDLDVTGRGAQRRTGHLDLSAQDGSAAWSARGDQPRPWSQAL
ncbi:hypothetical protein GCM10007304_46960 [Rhodococcoides trifolii]|uniref:Uncharacterized protein n=1 Tax=Rhodococcoides trifolii TaxID=908250 RepID=A0A917G834_9NOCA|nr:hypothetical protein [Rhodococcus trifolii]GGG27737.1 hypothetical protein GCM10007304_46960 [Rhodococcus trifolii]